MDDLQRYYLDLLGKKLGEILESKFTGKYICFYPGKTGVKSDSAGVKLYTGGRWDKTVAIFKNISKNEMQVVISDPDCKADIEDTINELGKLPFQVTIQ